MASFRSICRFCRGLQKRWETSGNICDVSATSVVKQACTRGSVFDRELRTSPLSTGKDGYTLPWPQYSKPFALREPIWNRQAGLFLLRRVANMLGEQFSVSDFLLGVKDAVYVLADTIAHQSKHEQLRRLLEPTLYSAVEESLTSLPTNAHIHLDIESIRNLQLVRVNGIIGTADPGDEHVIGWLGQKVITSEANHSASRIPPANHSASRIPPANHRASGIAPTNHRASRIPPANHGTTTITTI